MRIASSPTHRIASGLLLAVLLSVVGCQVVRRLDSHGPEVLLKAADGLSRPLARFRPGQDSIASAIIPWLLSSSPWILSVARPSRQATDQYAMTDTQGKTEDFIHTLSRRADSSGAPQTELSIPVIERLMPDPMIEEIVEAALRP